MIKKDYLVEKRNVLNEIRANHMKLEELRFFSIYLAKINPRDPNTRVVQFSIEDFRKIMGLGRMKIDYLKDITDSLLCKIVRVPTAKGGYDSFQLFKNCKVDADENDKWFIEIDAHDKALPLMFEFKEHYFTYRLWNALQLKSSNQLRMYEILKQYEKIGERIIFIDELKELLGISKSEYPRWERFRIRVLDACQQALQEYTDIKFTYEPIGKKGKGGKILTLKFSISKNEDYVDQLSLDEFIDQQDTEVEDCATIEEEAPKNKSIVLLVDACDNEFTESEIQILYNLIIKIVPQGKNGELEWYDYLRHRYDELKWRAGRTQITNRFGYLKKIIEADLLERV